MPHIEKEAYEKNGGTTENSKVVLLEQKDKGEAGQPKLH